MGSVKDKDEDEERDKNRWRPAQSTLDAADYPPESAPISVVLLRTKEPIEQQPSVFVFVWQRCKYKRLE